jgi:hypothetical protein
MFYLNNTEIDEPTGFTGVYWTRVRHPDYFGIWRHRTAKVMGVGEVGFTGQARALLLSLWKRDGINAKATFSVKDAGFIVYEADVDFAIHSDNGRYFNVSFRDQDIELDSLSSLKVGIDPEILIEFPEQSIADGISYTVASEPFYVDRIHSIPLSTPRSGEGEGNGLSVSSAIQQDPIYRNGTDRRVLLRLHGQVLGTWQGSGEISIRAESVQDGQAKDVRIVASLNASNIQQEIYILADIEIPPGGYLRLVVQGHGGMNVTYGSESYLTIHENAETATGFIWGVTWEQAIISLLSQLTNNQIQLKSDYLSKAKRVLTSERNLRGFRSKIQTSFKTLWDDINAIDNLACWRWGNELHIETKADMIRKVGRSRIESYSTLISYPSSFYSSSYRVGYANWQSGTAAGRDEFCTERTYKTDQSKIKDSKSIMVNSLSASGKTMEILRRNPKSDKADTVQDEKLFVIAADRIAGSYKAITGNLSSVINPVNSINADLSPRRILQRWSNVLGVNGKATFVSGTGNFSAISFGEIESSDVQPQLSQQLFDQNEITIETALSMRQYAELGEVIEYLDHYGQIRKALIREDSYRFATGLCNIKAIELQ